MSGKTETILMNKAELIMKLRDYRVKKLRKSKTKIDIKASKPNTDETVLIRIITNSKLAKHAIGVDQIRKMKMSLEEKDFDKVIVFGSRFTSAAQQKLRDDDIEFFSAKLKIFSTLDKQELYSNVIDTVNELCQIKCGHIPQSEAQCKGYFGAPIQCSFCGGSGKIIDHKCQICAGTGLIDHRYSCEVRLISDNADFHFKRDWMSRLQKDLSSILEILLAESSEHQITEATIEGNGGEVGEGSGGLHYV